MVVDGHSIAKFILGKEKDTQRKWIMAMGGGVAKMVDGRVVPKTEYADRVVRDKRYKIWVENRKMTRLFDMKIDPDEKNNLIDSTSPEVVSAREKFEAVINTFPAKDAAPQYTPVFPKAKIQKADKSDKRP